MDNDYEEYGQQPGDDYVHIDTESTDKGVSKAVVRTFVIRDFSDIKEILDSLRAQNTICFVNIQPLKDKDLVELKRAINKIKKTVDAVDGDIAGVDDYLIVTPGGVEIHRSKKTSEMTEEDIDF